MAHFAKLDENNVVQTVIVVDNSVLLDNDGNEKEELGVEYLKNIFGHPHWKQTSYNASFRKNYAGVDFVYDEENDAFIPPIPYKTWKLNTETYYWEPPFPKPDDGKKYGWSEETDNWEELTYPE